MAKLMEPVLQTGFARNYGKVLQFNNKRGVVVGRVYRAGSLANFFLFPQAGIVLNYIIHSWKKMDEQEKEIWRQLGEKFFVSGFELYKAESYKAFVGTKYNQSHYGVSTYLEEY